IDCWLLVHRGAGDGWCFFTGAVGRRVAHLEGADQLIQVRREQRQVITAGGGVLRADQDARPDPSDPDQSSVDGLGRVRLLVGSYGDLRDHALHLLRALNDAGQRVSRGPRRSHAGLHVAHAGAHGLDGFGGPGLEVADRPVDFPGGAGGVFGEASHLGRDHRHSAPAFRGPRGRARTVRSIARVEREVYSASLRTSVATTANPRPCSPARAASMLALRASMLVWSAISSMTPVMAPMASLARPSSSILVAVAWLAASSCWMVATVDWMVLPPAWAFCSALLASCAACWVVSRMATAALEISSMLPVILSPSVCCSATWLTDSRA